MKRRLLITVFAAVMAIACFFSFACGSNRKPKFEISLTSNDYILLEVGDEVDFTQYFTIKDKNGNKIPVEESMLDLSHVNTSVIGSFTVTLKIDDVSKTALFKVVPKGSVPDTPGTPSTPSEHAQYTQHTEYAEYAE